MKGLTKANTFQLAHMLKQKQLEQIENKGTNRPTSQIINTTLQ